MKFFAMLLISFSFASCGYNTSKVSVVTSVTQKGKVNINTASKMELMLMLDGVGEEKAKRIIESRKMMKFNDKYDLIERGLIGETSFKKIVKEVEIICNNN